MKIKQLKLHVVLCLLSGVGMLQAQNDTMYVMKSGVVIEKYNVKDQVDSIVFYNPAMKTNGIVATPIGDIAVASIPAGTFMMGSPVTDGLMKPNTK